MRQPLCFGAVLHGSTGCPLNGRVGICTLADPARRSLWFDSTVSDREFPRLQSLRYATFYFDSTVTPADLTRRMRPGDVAFGPGPGDVSVVRVALHTGFYFVVAVTSWGIDRNESVTNQHSGIGWIRRNLPPDLRQRTAAGASRSLIQRFSGEHFGLHPRWRRLAHAAVHGGPAVCVSGGGHDVTQIDIRSAYYTAMKQPFPLRWSGARYVDESVIRQENAIIEATVSVPNHERIGYIPPLPIVANDGGILYPFGTIRGAWTSEHLRVAVDLYGCKIVQIHQCMVGSMDSEWLGRALDSLDGMDPIVRKYLYTRAYGVMASRGGWTAQTMHPKEMPTWQDAALDLFTPTRNVSYRPDIAALVTGRIHAELFRALSVLDCAKTVAVHVDAIWTSANDSAEWIANKTGAYTWWPSTWVDGTPYTWAIKARGPVRYWHPGVYADGGEGESEAPRGSARVARVWALAPSWERRDAVSTAPRAKQDIRREAVNGPVTHSPLWDSVGNG